MLASETSVSTVEQRGNVTVRAFLAALEGLGDALRDSGMTADAAVAFAEAFKCGEHPERVDGWNPCIPTRKEAEVRVALGEQASADDLRGRAVGLLSGRAASPVRRRR
jgi:hypothetical protein